MSGHNWATEQIHQRKIEALIPYINNPRTHSARQLDQIAASIREWGWTMPILIDERDTVLAGHGRLEAAKKLGIEQVPVVIAQGWSEAKKKAYIIADNRLSENAGWDDELLKLEISDLTELEFDLPLLGFSEDELTELTAPERLTKGDYYQDSQAGALSKQFLIPPFSLFDTRQGYWQDRKRYWKGLGINSTEGRENDLIGYGEKILLTGVTETSEFDPVLAEVLYRWHVPPGGMILDPFAGGSVRGIVATLLERDYIGVDLRDEQTLKNRETADALTPDHQPIWITGDSHNIKKLCKGIQADFLFSCPPYHDLEKYSDDPDDLSNMDYPSFIKAYKTIIKNSSALLKENRFASFVVSDIRDKQGLYRGFVQATIDAFKEAGLPLYNEAILIHCCGSLGLRSRRPFEKSRKLGRHHQNVLIFIKGDPVAATEAIGPVELPDDSGDAASYGEILETDH